MKAFDDKPLLTLMETADYLGISTKTVRRLIARQKLRPVDWSRRLLIPAKQIEKLCEVGSD